MNQLTLFTSRPMPIMLKQHLTQKYMKKTLLLSMLYTY
ncbi:hypothetical protein KP77_21620 [Jeotgalibacillus alimentarius]|uniref:Uncharacterized protein n=1 Tax=Jeotgalibacillus alimentarius TaxID=135826 RepID=A0A0C2VX24_9BACL|nr:hypothetical protein KP77_21620 [Jeotgalibacillus alimentarius]